MDLPGYMLAVALIVAQTICLNIAQKTTTHGLMEQPACPRIPCANECEVDYRGRCPRCVCPMTCKDIECAKNEHCILQNVTCIDDSPCFPEPTCIDNSMTGNTEKCLTDVVCSEGCYKILPPNGCPKCVCIPPITCNVVGCPDDMVCVMKEVLCEKPPCSPEPECVPKEDSMTTTMKVCPLILCLPHCDLQDGPDGCQRCVCPSTCEAVRCRDGYECQLIDDVTCDKPKCFPQPRCVPIKITTKLICLPARLNCLPTCKRVLGPDGCPRCDCPPTCKTVKCPAGNECQLVKVPCDKTPCLPQPKCVPIKKTTTPKNCPKLKCLPTCFPSIGPDGCPDCDCPPTCKTVKCSAGYECQLIEVLCDKPRCFPQPKCVPIKTRTTKKICPLWRCSSSLCSPGPIGPDGCPTCDCPPTCKTIRCSAGNECQLVKVACDEPPCLPRPKCVPIKRTTTQKICPLWSCPSSICFPGPIGPDGCPTCDCPPTCKTIRCAAGYECQLVTVACEDSSCLPQPKCVPIKITTTPKICPMLRCLPICSPGIGPDGCPICDCPPTCKSIECSPGYECELVDVACEESPCLPQPKCVPIEIMTTPKNCPMLKCLPTCFPSVGPDGCPDCACPPTCENVKCSAGSECQLVKVKPICVPPSCFPQPTCVPMRATTKTTKPCTPIKCSLPCVQDVLAGRCPVCVCPQTCKNKICSSGYECELVKVQCFRAPCFPLPTCVPRKTNPSKLVCPAVACLPGCVSVVGPNGCRTCECPKTCKTVTCPAGDECVLLHVTCKRSPCFPQPTCVPIKVTKSCPKIRCARPCEQYRGTDGCPKCECPPTCKTVRCRIGYQCELVNVTCVRFPCFPQPTCVPIKTTPVPIVCPQVPCPGWCSLSIEPNGCETCDCPQTSCTSTIMCEIGYQCELLNVPCDQFPCFPQPTCVPIKTTPVPIVCPQVTCPDRCSLGIDSNGCETCDCPQTCDLDCVVGYQCVLVKVNDNCKLPSCPLQPKCVPITSTGTTPTTRKTIRPCPKIRCLPPCLTKIDSDGCPRCRCPPSCKALECIPGSECVLVNVECDQETCFPQPVCRPISTTPTTTPATRKTIRPCPRIMCVPPCVTQIDSDGCPRCRCPPSCKALDCIRGSECVLVNVKCKQEPCFPQPRCRPIPTTPTVRSLKRCPKIKPCPSECQWQYSAGGCPLCVCPPTCKNVRCATDYECALVEVSCKTEQSCYRQPRCVPMEGPCPARPPCDLACPFGLKVDENNCFLCECRDEPI